MEPGANTAAKFVRAAPTSGLKSDLCNFAGNNGVFENFLIDKESFLIDQERFLIVMEGLPDDKKLFPNVRESFCDDKESFTVVLEGFDDDREASAMDLKAEQSSWSWHFVPKIWILPCE